MVRRRARARVCVYVSVKEHDALRYLKKRAGKYFVTQKQSGMIRALVFFQAGSAPLHDAL